MCVCVHDCAMKIVFTARQKLTVFIMQGPDGQKGRNGPIGDPVSWSKNIEQSVVIIIYCTIS